MFESLKDTDKATRFFIILIGFAEILIGGLALTVNLISLIHNNNPKSPNVLLFVILTGLTSTIIGIEWLRLNKLAHHALLYFASVVFVSKILILMGILELNGALETSLPPEAKNVISLIYHGFLIYYLSTKHVKDDFKVSPYIHTH